MLEFNYKLDVDHVGINNLLVDVNYKIANSYGI